MVKEMKVVLFEIHEKYETVRYTSHWLEIDELERLESYISQLIADKKAMMPKSED